MLPTGRSRTSIARERRAHAEDRYLRYHDEVRHLLSDADGQARTGNWREATSKLTACMQSVAALVGVTTELELLYQITDD